MIFLYIIICLCGMLSGNLVNMCIRHKCRMPDRFFPLIIQGINTGLYLLIFLVNGLNFISILYSLMASVLLVVSAVDFYTFEIPLEYNLLIGAIGLIRLDADFEHWSDYVIGFFSVSVFLQILFIVSKGRIIGGGDVKLMAVCGLLVGWRFIWIAFFAGCVLGFVIHSIRMKVCGADKALAMGPYLSAGVLIAVLWGKHFLEWYFGAVI